MVLTKVIEWFVGLGKPCDGFIQKCFTSLMEASIRLKNIQEEKEEYEDDDEEAESDEDIDDETEDDDEV